MNDAEYWKRTFAVASRLVERVLGEGHEAAYAVQVEQARRKFRRLQALSADEVLERLGPVGRAVDALHRAGTDTARWVELVASLTGSVAEALAVGTEPTAELALVQLTDLLAVTT